MHFFERVCDSSNEFSVRPTLEPEFATLSELIDIVLGANLGQLVLSQVGGDLSDSTSLYDRLRSVLKPGTSPEFLGWRC